MIDIWFVLRSGLCYLIVLESDSLHKALFLRFFTVWPEVVDDQLLRYPAVSIYIGGNSGG